MEQRIRSSPKRNKLNVVLGVIGIIIVTLVACWLLAEKLGPQSDFCQGASLICISWFVTTLILIIATKYPWQWFAASLSAVAMLVAINHLYADGFDKNFPSLSELPTLAKIIIPLIGLGALYALIVFFRHYSELAKVMKKKIESFQPSDEEPFGSHESPCAALSSLEKRVEKNEKAKSKPQRSGLKTIGGIVCIIIDLAIIGYIIYNSMQPEGQDLKAILNNLAETVFNPILLIILVSILIGGLKLFGNEVANIGALIPILIIVSISIDKARGDQDYYSFFRNLVIDGNYIIPSLCLAFALALIAFTYHLLSVFLRALHTKQDEQSGRSEFETKITHVAIQSRNKCVDLAERILKIVASTAEGFLDIVSFVPSFFGSLSELVLGENEITDSPSEKQNEIIDETEQYREDDE
ncbi:MAG: hypothetical protein IKH21_07595 [Clostridia bacterium]|nr:hypothetical protein [Clostridia bacterium]